MAKIKISGLEDIEKMLLRKEKAAHEAIPKMLEAGARVLIKAQREQIKQTFHGDRSTGELVQSIKATPVKESAYRRAIYVYPDGDQDHGSPKKGQTGKVSNAQIGFINEYGTSSISGKHWLKAAKAKCQDELNAEMRKAWEEQQNE